MTAQVERDDLTAKGMDAPRMEELLERLHSLERATVTDELTGLSNMKGFRAGAVDRAAEDLAAGRTPIYLLFDVWNFQTFNDRFGYDSGNELLIALGEILREQYPDQPCARKSGDHFVVLTNDAEDYPERVRAVNAALRARYKNETYLSVRAGVYPVQSAGVEPLHAVDRARYVLALMQETSDELTIVYDDQRSKDYHVRQYVLNNIDRAVEQGYIQPYYQPVMWGADETLCGCEALARWIDPEVGFLSPGLFIPILEESRQIHRLDRSIYESVCRNMRKCLDEHRPVLPTSINFSQLDFELMDAVGELEALVEKYQIPRSYLHVEITESMLSKDREGLKRNMERLHESGYVIWLDDFGSGYSSMNVLKDFDFDLMKIDMGFLRNFSGNVKAYKVISSIIKLARDLGMETLTEGVEDQEHVDFLRGEGCGRLQGFYYGKPMPYADILAKIEDGTLTLKPSMPHGFS